MRRTRRGESYDTVGTGDCSGLRPDNIGISTRGNIYCNYGQVAAVDLRNCLSIKITHRRTEPRAQDRIHQNIGGEGRMRSLTFQIFPGTHDYRRIRQLLEHFGGIAAQIRRLGKEKQVYFLARFT